MIDVTKSIQDFLTTREEITFPVYLNSRPQEVNDCITVVGNSGAAPSLSFQRTEVISYPLINLYIRSSQYSDGFEQASLVRSALFEYTDFENGIDGCTIYGDVSPIGYDDLRRAEFLLTIKCYVKG